LLLDDINFSVLKVSGLNWRDFFYDFSHYSGDNGEAFSICSHKTYKFYFLFLKIYTIKYIKLTTANMIWVAIKATVSQIIAVTRLSSVLVLLGLDNANIITIKAKTANVSISTNTPYMLNLESLNGLTAIK